MWHNLTYEHLHFIDVLGMDSGDRWRQIAIALVAGAALVPGWRRLRA